MGEPARSRPHPGRHRASHPRRGAARQHAGLPLRVRRGGAGRGHGGRPQPDPGGRAPASRPRPHRRRPDPDRAGAISTTWPASTSATVRARVSHRLLGRWRRRRRASTSTPRWSEVLAEDPASRSMPTTRWALIFTSGTSGAPKAVICTQRRLLRDRQPHGHHHRDRPRRRRLHRDAAVPLERGDGGLGAVDRGRGLGRAGPPIQRVGLPARRPPLRRHVVQLHGQAAVVPGGLARAPRRRRQHAARRVRQRGRTAGARRVRPALRRRGHRRLRLDRGGRRPRARRAGETGGDGPGRSLDPHRRRGREPSARRPVRRRGPAPQRRGVRR